MFTAAVYVLHFSILPTSHSGVFQSRLKPSFFKVFTSTAIHLAQAYLLSLTTRCLAVTGGGSVGECGKLSQPELAFRPNII